MNRRPGRPVTERDAHQAPAFCARAACRGVGPELAEKFYPPKGASSPEVFALCARCPVQTECLAYALSFAPSQQYGVWGGTTPNYRRALLLKRKKEGKTP